MASEQVEALAARLEKGHAHVLRILGDLSPDQWEQTVYENPTPWRIRDLLAHFVSAEENLLALAQEVAAGGAGAPPGFDYDAFNAAEVQRLGPQTAVDLLDALTVARKATLDWLRQLDDQALQLSGRHPALGEVSLEIMITAIYGHQLMHMRDLMPRLGA
jgi:hypothetical protein